MEIIKLLLATPPLKGIKGYEFKYETSEHLEHQVRGFTFENEDNPGFQRFSLINL